MSRTSVPAVPGIYEAGACTGLLSLASVAGMQGRIEMYHALGEGVGTIWVRFVAATVFTRTEIANGGGATIGDRQRFGICPDHHAAVADQSAGEDVRGASWVCQDVLPPIYSVC